MTQIGTAVLFPLPRAWLRGLALALVALAPGLVAAAEKSVTGVIVQIPTSITTDSVARLRASLFGPLKRFEQEAAGKDKQFVVLCDFNPEGRRSELVAKPSDLGSSPNSRVLERLARRRQGGAVDDGGGAKRL